MQRHWTGIKASALLLLALAGCGRRSPVPETLDREEIRFGAATGDAFSRQDSKSLIEDDSDLRNAPEGIGVFGRVTLGGSVLPVYDNDRITYGYTYDNVSLCWGGSTVRYWIAGGSYTFAAVYPYTGAGVSGIGSGAVTWSDDDGTLTVDCGYTDSSNAMSKDAPDLMAGTAERDLTAETGVSGDYSPVGMAMHHLLACVEFRVYNASDATVYRAGYPRLTGIRYMGEAEVSADGSAQWTISDETVASDGEEYYEDSYTLEDIAVSTTESRSLTGEMTVLPQQTYGSGRNITFSFQTRPSESSDNVFTYSYTISSISSVRSWEAGKKYVYTATVTSDYIVFNVEVRDWRDGGTYLLN